MNPELTEVLVVLRNLIILPEAEQDVAEAYVW